MSRGYTSREQRRRTQLVEHRKLHNHDFTTASPKASFSYHDDTHFEGHSFQRQLILFSPSTRLIHHGLEDNIDDLGLFEHQAHHCIALVAAQELYI